MQLQGHDAQKALLAQMTQHSLLFTGPTSVGRRQIARWFAQYLNCQNPRDSEPCGVCESCQSAQNEMHPDYREVAPKTLTSTGKRKPNPEILISQLVQRDDSEDIPLSRWLETPPSYKRRVAVIDSAHTLNLNAANAFLKVLEEPPNHAVIILIAPSTQAVLPTIASRTTVVRFATVANSSAESPLARLGRPGDSILQQQEAERFEHLQTVIKTYFQALPKGLELAFEAGDALEKVWLSETLFGVADLILAYVNEHEPEHYYAVAKAIERFEDVTAVYGSANLAMQRLSLELRRDMNYSVSMN